MTAAPKRGRGRPAQPTDQRRTIHLDVRVSPEELARYQAAADEAGVSLSEWARDGLDEATARR